MADIVDSVTRSRMMAGIRGKNTKPELLVRELLTKAGLRYRLHRRDLPGAPDVVIPSMGAAIFVHGCFWHVHANCRFAKWPATRPEFWRSKLTGNADRDADVAAMLNLLGWRVLVVWECSTRSAKPRELLSDALLSWLGGSEAYGEVGAEPLQ
jgi:DNA mismatch endonuclease, patch repair protein